MISSMYIGKGILVSFHFPDGVDNFFFDDFEDGEINYYQIKNEIKIDGENKSIKDRREFTNQQKPVAINV